MESPFDLRNFLIENKLTSNSKLINEGNFVLKSIEKDFGIKLELWDSGKYLELSKIIIPKEKRGEGMGSEIMNIITDYADDRGLKIYLTPSKDFGATSITRLENFYKEHGFIKNIDKSETRNTMVRFPK